MLKSQVPTCAALGATAATCCATYEAHSQLRVQPEACNSLYVKNNTPWAPTNLRTYTCYDIIMGIAPTVRPSILKASGYRATQHVLNAAGNAA